MKPFGTQQYKDYRNKYCLQILQVDLPKHIIAYKLFNEIL